MLNYNYKGKSGIKVKIVTFKGMPDFILSQDQWNEAGGWKGLIKEGTVPLKEVIKVHDGTMSMLAFFALEAWEG